MIVDDAIVRIGSSNLANRSMAFDTECDLAIEARGEARVAATIREFRERLLAEHLGTQPARVREEIERAGSLHGAIAAFSDQPRTLRQFEELPEWSETVLTHGRGRRSRGADRARDSRLGAPRRRGARRSGTPGLGQARRGRRHRSPA